MIILLAIYGIIITCLWWFAPRRVTEVVRPDFSNNEPNALTLRDSSGVLRKYKRHLIWASLSETDKWRKGDECWSPSTGWNKIRASEISWNKSSPPTSKSYVGTSAGRRLIDVFIRVKPEPEEETISIGIVTCSKCKSEWEALISNYALKLKCPSCGHININPTRKVKL